MELLFAYGSLRKHRIQRKLLGREIEGKHDVLPCYRRTTLRIEDSSYYVAVPSPSDSLEGIVLEVKAKELEILDIYETVAYKRVKETLLSGLEAWVYVKAEKK